MFYMLGAVESAPTYASDGYAMRFHARDSRLDACLVLKPLNEAGRRRLARLSPGAQLTLTELNHLVPDLLRADFSPVPVDIVPSNAPPLVLQLSAKLEDVEAVIMEVSEDRPFVARLVRNLYDLAVELKHKLHASGLDPAIHHMARIQTSEPDGLYMFHAREDGSWWVSDEGERKNVVLAGAAQRDPTAAIGDWLVTQGLTGWSFTPL